ncbi:MAG: prephenate dehydrogenase/arogenate dehydrogenase family protein [bacterium]|nr:prephenate dehydrogenase/arogenate dehydrogenase family protein [bacterium]
MQKISIVGYGRFGKVLYRLLKDDFEITLYSTDKVEKTADFTTATIIATDVSEVYKNDVIFYAVPIDAFESVVLSHKKYFEKRHTFIDVLSVKMHPAKVFREHLDGTGASAILTHPMFGPDSTKRGFDQLPIILDRCSASAEVYDFWKKFFQSKDLHVVEMSPEEHDKMAADSQGLTHFIGRLLEMYPLQSSEIDTLGTKRLLEVKDLTCNDTWQLFSNLQHYNPYTKEMRIKLGEAYDTLYNKLLPQQVSHDYVTYGIQGGIGSFNEEAIRYYLKNAKPHEYKIQYLYTSENVMRALHAGEIDRGQLAIHNSLGGMVGESIHAMAAYKFKIVEEFAIKISHALMIRKDAELSSVDTIMAHPQVFAQCKNNLKEKYPNLKLVSGEGDLIDHAVVAKELAAGNLPKSTATMGSKTLAQIYDLKIVEDNLQDAKENYTSFLQVARIQS